MLRNIIFAIDDQFATTEIPNRVPSLKVVERRRVDVDEKVNIVCPVESEIVYSRRPSNENYIHENLIQIFPIQCCHLVMNEQKFSRHAKSQFFVFRKILTLKEAEKVTQDHVYPERLRVYKVKTFKPGSVFIKSLLHLVCFAMYLNHTVLNVCTLV